MCIRDSAYCVIAVRQFRGTLNGLAEVYRPVAGVQILPSPRERPASLPVNQQLRIVPTIRPITATILSFRLNTTEVQSLKESTKTRYHDPSA